MIGSTPIGPFLRRVRTAARRLAKRMSDYYNGEVIRGLRPHSLAPLRALDVGCGAGQHMADLRRAGWEIEGVEWDPLAAAIARKTSGCAVWEGDFLRVTLPSGEYNLVLLSHVFEHIGEPVAALHRIRELLAPGGEAVIIYPNPESMGARVFGNAWLSWDAPRHLVLPPLESLVQAAVRIGLTPLKRRTAGKYAEWSFAVSRVFQAGKPVDLHRPPRINGLDRLLAIVERVGTCLGLKAGEDVVVVLRKA